MANDGVADIDVAEGTAAASLLALASNMEVMRRLLGRHFPDGGLVPADAALFRIAINTARIEVRHVGELLGGVPEGPICEQRSGIAAMRVVVADLAAYQPARRSAPGIDRSGRPAHRQYAGQTDRRRSACEQEPETWYVDIARPKLMDIQGAAEPADAAAWSLAGRGDSDLG